MKSKRSDTHDEPHSECETDSSVGSCDQSPRGSVHTLFDSPRSNDQAKKQRTEGTVVATASRSATITQDTNQEKSSTLILSEVKSQQLPVPTLQMQNLTFLLNNAFQSIQHQNLNLDFRQIIISQLLAELQSQSVINQQQILAAEARAEQFKILSQTNYDSLMRTTFFANEIKTKLDATERFLEASKLEALTAKYQVIQSEARAELAEKKVKEAETRVAALELKNKQLEDLNKRIKDASDPNPTLSPLGPDPFWLDTDDAWKEVLSFTPSLKLGTR